MRSEAGSSTVKVRLWFVLNPFGRPRGRFLGGSTVISAAAVNS